MIYCSTFHRDHCSRSEVVIYGYADINVSILARMFESRLKGYKAIGYESAEFGQNR